MSAKNHWASELGMAVRVAARYQRAFEFPTEHALDRYLKEHPDADRSQHTVKKQEHKDTAQPEEGGPKKPAKPEEGAEGEPGKEKSEGEGTAPHEKPKSSWKDAVKNLSSKALTFFKSAPEGIKKFATDEDFRRKTLMAAHEAIEKAPEQYLQRAKKAVKHEAHELKAAGEGVWTLLKGGKLDEHQKKAIKAVAIDLAIVTAVSAVTGGLAGGAGGLVKKTAGAFGYGMLKKIAAKTVHEGLTHAPVLHELAHGFEGLADIAGEFLKFAADDEEKPSGNSNRVPDPEEVLDMFVAGVAMYCLKHVDASSLTDGLDACADLGEQTGEVDTDEAGDQTDEDAEEEEEEDAPGFDEDEEEDAEAQPEEEEEPEGQEKLARRVANSFRREHRRLEGRRIVP